MTPDRHEKISKIFTRVRELPEAEQDAELRKRCGDDAKLRAEVRSLLRAESELHLLDDPMGVTATLDLATAAMRIADPGFEPPELEDATDSPDEEPVPEARPGFLAKLFAGLRRRND